MESLKSLEVKKDIHWVGALDHDLRVFDIIMYTPFGTTYNSYLVKGSEKTAVFETVKVQFFDEYIERLKSLGTDVNKIDYIVVDHTEPDHAGSVAKLLELSPKAKVVGSAAAIKFLEQIANRDFESITVGDGDSLSLGNKTLKFISAPFLHWPDSIYTYIPEDNVLVTCDSFGSHFCFDGVFDDLIPNEEEANYMDALRYYYNCIFGPYKSFVLKAIDKIKDLPIDTICTGHGPILRKDPWKIVSLYKEWSTPAEPRKDGKKKVTISYVSAYGYTEELAHKIAEGINSTGDYEIKLYNIIYNDMKDILADISDSDGVLFGSPTIVGELLEPVRDLLSKLNPVVHGGKVAGAFGSYGWSGEAVPRIETRLEELKMKIHGPGLKINFKPSEEDLTKAFQYGAGFGEMILGKNSSKDIPPQASTIKEVKGGNGEIKLWKCLVCGEIFESQEVLDICPVCGAGSDQFIEVKKEEDKFKKDTNETFIIVGNGAAGFYAARQIREINSTCTIKLISKEEVPSYFRPQLSDLLTENISDSKFYIVNEQWYIDNNIEQILGTSVINIDSKNKNVTLSNKEVLPYDKLILATGSYNLVPPVKVNSGENEVSEINSYNYKSVNGIYTIKDLNDAYDVKDAIKTSKKAVVIGGGLLGLEAAWEINNSGLNVTVVEYLPRLLPRQLDNEGSELLKKIIDKSPVEILLGESCIEILVTDNKVTGIKLNSGKTLDCDLLLFSAGIRANTELAKLAGVEFDKGIKVNEKMETNIPDIYACGDVAEFNGILYGNWPAAVEMGKIAGANAASKECKFKNFASSVIFNAMNAQVFSAGTIDFNNENYKIVSTKDSKNNIYSKLFYENNDLKGGILIGNLSNSSEIIRNLK